MMSKEQREIRSKTMSGRKQDENHVKFRTEARLKSGWFKDHEKTSAKISESKKEWFNNLPEEEKETIRNRAREIGKARQVVKEPIFCEHCKKQLIKQQKRFCSRSCRNKTIKRQDRKGKIVNCLFCGIDFYVKPSHASRRIYCSKSCQGKNIAKLKNEYSDNDIRLTDVTKFYHSKQREQWSLAVLKKDNFTCQICGKKDRLHAHHIKPIKYFPELSLDISNGLALCVSCHFKKHH